MLEPLHINARDAARLTGYSVKWFEHERCNGSGPPYVKLPNGRVRYPYKAFLKWWAEQTGEVAA